MNSSAATGEMPSTSTHSLTRARSPSPAAIQMFFGADEVAAAGLMFVLVGTGMLDVLSACVDDEVKCSSRK